MSPYDTTSGMTTSTSPAPVGPQYNYQKELAHTWLRAFDKHIEEHHPRLHTFVDLATPTGPSAPSMGLQQLHNPLSASSARQDGAGASRAGLGGGGRAKIDENDTGAPQEPLPEVSSPLRKW